jgi:hypothetical protein
MEAVGNTLEKMGSGNDTLNESQKVQHQRERMNKCIKLKSCTAKETVTRLKRLHTEWKKIFGIHSSDKVLISRIYRKVTKHNLQGINMPMKKWAHELNMEFSKEVVQMSNKCMKKCSTSLAIKEM